MAKKDLRIALGSIVEQYGFDTVSQALHEIEPAGGRPSARGGARARSQTRRTRGRPTKRRLSAIEYVQAMEVQAERAAVVRRAAEEFERRAFLPTLGDIRSFCEAYGLEELKSNSRSSGIPRIFKLLATTEVADLERILDDRLFSGPTELGPIADAIRERAGECRQAAIHRT